MEWLSTKTPEEPKQEEDWLDILFQFSQDLSTVELLAVGEIGPYVIKKTKKIEWPRTLGTRE